MKIRQSYSCKTCLEISDVLGAHNKQEGKMKKLAVVVIAIMLSVVFTDAVSAQMRTEKGPSAKAYEKASENSAFNRVGDWFATRGKSDQERQVILTQRKAARTAERVKKETARRARQAEKQANKAKKDMGKAMKM